MARPCPGLGSARPPRRSRQAFPGTFGTLLRRTIAEVHAVDEVSLDVRRGETLGLVGETGCGKSTLARCIARLYDLTAGRVIFDGHDISTLTRRQLRPYRRELQRLQDPYGITEPAATGRFDHWRPVCGAPRRPTARSASGRSSC